MTTRDFLHTIIEPAPLADTLVTGLLAMPDDASKSICRVYGWTHMPTDFASDGGVERIMVVRIIIERDALLEFTQTTMRNLFMG